MSAWEKYSPIRLAISPLAFATAVCFHPHPSIFNTTSQMTFLKSEFHHITIYLIPFIFTFFNYKMVYEAFKICPSPVSTKLSLMGSSSTPTVNSFKGLLVKYII
jgi:hypothetical protein